MNKLSTGSTILVLFLFVMLTPALGDSPFIISVASSCKRVNVSNDLQADIALNG